MPHITGGEDHHMKLPASLTSLFYLLLVAPAFSATYYVSNHGSDTNPGTDPTTPWATLAKLNEKTLLPGDAVMLDCASSFRETLSVDQSGRPGALISYSNYGNCPNHSLPLLSGADTVSNWASEKVANVPSYASTFTVAPAVVFEDSQRLKPVASEAALVRGTFFYDADLKKLHLRTRDDSSPAAHLIEVPVRPYVIQGYRTSYVSLTGIEADKALLDDVNFTGSLTNLTLWTVNAAYAVRNGMWFSANTGE